MLAVPSSAGLLRRTRRLPVKIMRVAVNTVGWGAEQLRERPAPDVQMSPGRAAIELAALLILIETIMWVVPLLPHPRATYAGFATMIALLLAYCFIKDDFSAWQLGFRADNFFRVLLDLAPFLILFVAVILGIAGLTGDVRFKPRFFSMVLVVPFWAIFQQYMLLAFANRRLRVILGKGAVSTVATAALFALLHVPNPALVVATAVGGYLWAWEYERRPNIMANSITHGIASAFLANLLPHWLLKNMVVGYNYYLR